MKLQVQMNPKFSNSKMSVNDDKHQSEHPTHFLSILGVNIFTRKPVGLVLRCPIDLITGYHQFSPELRLGKTIIVQLQKRKKMKISCRVRGDWFQVPANDGEFFPLIFGSQTFTLQ